MRAAGGEIGKINIAMTALADTQAGDQRPVDQEVRIAPNGRGEMHVFRQAKTEMTNVIDAVNRLRLAAKNQFIDHRCMGCVGGLGQDRVEQTRFDDLPARQVQFQAIEKIA